MAPSSSTASPRAPSSSRGCRWTIRASACSRGASCSTSRSPRRAWPSSSRCSRTVRRSSISASGGTSPPGTSPSAKSGAAAELLKGKVGDDPSLATLLGRAYYQDGNPAEAIAVLEPFARNLLAGEPSSPSERALMADLALAYGQALVGVSKWPEAAAALDPGDAARSTEHSGLAAPRPRAARRRPAGGRQPVDGEVPPGRGGPEVEHRADQRGPAERRRSDRAQHEARGRRRHVGTHATKRSP